MKYRIFITAIALIISIHSDSFAMTLTDVLQQHSVYKTNPSVLGASNPGVTPVGFLKPEESKVLIEGLRYTAKSPAIITTTLKAGATNSDEVKKLQLFLIAKGYLNADPTGKYGMLTKAAVKKFQADKKIKGDGTIVGPATRAAISNDVKAVTSDVVQ